MALLVCAAACGRPGGELEVEPLPTPAGDGSHSPYLSVGADGVAMLSWIEPLAEGGHALRFASLEDNGWGPAGEVARGQDWFVNQADVPALEALFDGTLAAAWLEKLGQGTYAYGIRVALSSDDGTSWSEPMWLHGDRSESEHGFVSVKAFGDDAFGTVWLDGRATTPAGAGAMQLRGRTLRRDGTVGLEQVLDDRVCDCCPTALVRVRGRTLVAYRDRSEDEVRDIGLVSMEERGTALRLLHEDGWRIEGCPVNGPALDVRGSLVGAAWYSEGSGEPRVQCSLSRDGGQRFAAPRTLSRGSAFGAVDATFGTDGALWVSWLEALPDGGGAWVLRRVDPGGAVGEPRRIVGVPAGRGAGIARLVALGDALLFAWTDLAEDGTKQVRSARLALTD